MRAQTAQVVRWASTSSRSSSVATLPGKLRLVAVDDRGAYVVDEDAGWNRLIVVGLSDGAVQGEIRAPDVSTEAFGPRRSVVDAESGRLFTLARHEDSERLELLGTDLRGREVTLRVPLEGIPDLGVGMVLSMDGKHVFVYFPAGPHLVDVDLLNQRASLLGLDQAGDNSGLPAEGNLLAEDPKGKLLYLALPSAGVAVVSQSPLQPLRELATDRRYRAIGISSDGGSLYTLGFDGAYRVFDAVSGVQRATRGQLRAVDILQVTAGE